MRLAQQVAFALIGVAYFVTFVVGTELHEVFSLLITLVLIKDIVVWFRNRTTQE